MVYITVSVAYVSVLGSAFEQFLCVPPGSSAMFVIRASGVLERYKEIAIATVDLGVFGKKINRDYPLRAGDRVEIYRFLQQDPKTLRKKRTQYTT